MSRELQIKFALLSLSFDGMLLRGDLIEKYIFLRNRFYESDFLQKIKRQYNLKDAVIVDVGANIGNHSVFFSKSLEAGFLYCFEPVKSTYDILIKNLRLNNINNCRTYNVALGSEEGNASIDISEKDNRGATAIKYDNAGEMKVVTLDNINFEKKIDFLKIDVEGFEKEVLGGAVEFLKRNKPIIMIEIFENNFNAVNSFLDKVEYHIAHRLDEKNYIYESNL